MKPGLTPIPQTQPQVDIAALIERYALGLKQPTVSYHLKQLIDAGVITREQHGRFAFYSLQPGFLERIADLVRPAVPA